MPSALIEIYDVAGDGPTVAVKDCIDIAGARTTCGSRAFADVMPAIRHAAVVQALVDSGYRITGKASMHELAYGMTGVNAWTGPVGNPRYPGTIPGGSSSGSAASVASGLVDIALGTDTGGSVRLPAACCGVVGYKPTFGRLSREGVAPIRSNLDCVGILARAVEPVERAMTCLDPSYVNTNPVGSLNIALVDVPADPEIAATLNGWLHRPGINLQGRTLPRIDDAFMAGVVQMAAEAHEAYGQLVEIGLLGEDVEQRLRAAPTLATPERRGWADRVRDQFIKELDALFEDFDVLALPTLPDFPPLLDALGEPAEILRLSAFVRPFNLSGHPAISLPLATPSGRAAAVQLVAPGGADARLCAIARFLFDDVHLSQNKDQT